MPLPRRSRADIRTHTWASIPARITRRVPAAWRRPRTSSTPQQEKFTFGTGWISGPSVSTSSGRVWPRPLGYCSVATTGRRRRRAAVLDGLGHVLRGYPLTSAQVGDSAGNFEDAIVTSGGEAEVAHRPLEEKRRLERRSAEAPHLAAAH